MPDKKVSGTFMRRWLRYGFACLLLACVFSPADAQEIPNQPATVSLPAGLTGGPEAWSSPEGLTSAIQVMLLLTVISLAPAVLMMTTCFIRIIVVLGLLRQARQLVAELLPDVLDARQVLARVRQASLGLLAPLLVFRDAGRFLQEHP